MPREFKRTQRVAQAITRELSVLILKEVSDPRILPVSIADVKVSRDFAHAKIYFSVLEDEQAKEAEVALNQASGFLRTLLAARIKLRMMPKLHFVYDDTLVRARKMDKLIDSLFPNGVDTPSSNSVSSDAISEH